MKYKVTLRLLPYFLLMATLVLLLACQSKKNIEEQIRDMTSLPQSVVLKNVLRINNTNGHLQGMQVFQLEDKSYFFFSGSSDSIAYFAIADAATQSIITVDTFLTGAFRHAGGFQIFENLLAVGIEDNIKVDRSKVLVYEILPLHPPRLKLLKTIDRWGAPKRYTAGCVALTEYQDSLLLAVGNWDAKQIDFYSIARKKLQNAKENFRLRNSFDAQFSDRTTWSDTSWHSYQNINFITDREQKLYLLGTAKKDTTVYELIDLFKVQKSPTNTFSLKKVQQRSFINTDTTTTLQWGGGVYHDPNDQLHIFSSARNIGDSLLLSRYDVGM